MIASLVPNVVQLAPELVDPAPRLLRQRRPIRSGLLERSAQTLDLLFLSKVPGVTQKIPVVAQTEVDPWPARAPLLGRSVGGDVLADCGKALGTRLGYKDGEGPL